MSKSQTERLSIGWLEAGESGHKKLIAKKLGSGDQHAVDDIWQELLLAAEKVSKETQQIEVPKAWVRQVINHKVADYFRSKQRVRRLEDSISEAMESTISSTPFDWVLELEDRQQVRDALLKCSVENREILRLKYFNEVSVAEIASNLNITAKAAEYRLSRARKEFRECITQINQD